MTQPLDERASELREVFFETAHELLQSLNEDGLALERGTGGEEAIRRVRRVVHTLKGDSAAIGMRELSQIAHEFEDVLTPELAADRSEEVAEAVLAAADTFESLLTAEAKNHRSPGCETLRVLIRKLCAEGKAGGPHAAVPTRRRRAKASFAWNEYEQTLILEAISKGETVYHAGVSLDTANLMPSAAWQLVRNVLHSCGTVLVLHPADDAHAEQVEVVEAALSSKLPLETLRKRLRIPAVTGEVVLDRADVAGEPLHELVSPQTGDEEEAAIPPAASSSAGPNANSMATAATAGTAEGESAASRAVALAEKTLRVDSERIDDVLNLVGELIIGKSMLYQTINEFGRRYPKDPLKNRFTDAMSKQAQVLNALQRSVMKIRMVPVDQLFRRFPRVLRDAAKACGKEVELITIGADTDLDKGILDALSEPLTHLLRNAVDHGIESPQERVAKGKSPQGFIKLNAYHQANHVVIELTDDGRGIDPEKVVAKAIERGMLSAEDAARLSDAQKMELIFESGFSTAEQVTAISGRGVGMDVVRSVLGRLKGTVQIISNIDKGTTFRLTMPLTLAIIKAMLFSVGEQYFAVPLNTVVEITRAHYDQVHHIDNCEVLRLRDEVITLARLSRMMPQAHETSISKFFVVVVGLGERKFGLIVDKLVGEDELVIKAMDDQLVATDLVSGASILGDGTVVLILNIPALVDRVGFVRSSMAGMPLVSQSEGVGAAL